MKSYCVKQRKHLLYLFLEVKNMLQQRMVDI